MFKELDPLLHVQQRLAIVSILVSLEEADFTYIKEKTAMTAGNLSSHIDKLEAAGYIEVNKFINGKRPRTVCSISPKGLEAFENYVNALKDYIKM